jgi:hypothetical protein
MMRLATIGLLIVALLTGTGCYHPALAPHDTPPPSKNSIAEPYDEVWDATVDVITNNELKVQAEDPVHGILEAQGRHFTLQDADCGKVSTPLGKVPAEPTLAATTVFNFYLKPNGPEATTVSIQATFSTPGNAPFHPVSNLNCISNGRQEALLLKQIKKAAAQQRRPVYKPPSVP